MIYIFIEKLNKSHKFFSVQANSIDFLLHENTKVSWTWKQPTKTTQKHKVVGNGWADSDKPVLTNCVFKHFRVLTEMENRCVWFPFQNICYTTHTYTKKIWTGLGQFSIPCVDSLLCTTLGLFHLLWAVFFSILEIKEFIQNLTFWLFLSHCKLICLYCFIRIFSLGPSMYQPYQGGSSVTKWIRLMLPKISLVGMNII